MFAYRSFDIINIFMLPMHLHDSYNIRNCYNSNIFIKNTKACMLLLLQAPMAAFANNKRSSNY